MSGPATMFSDTIYQKTHQPPTWRRTFLELLTISFQILKHFCIFIRQHEQALCIVDHLFRTLKRYFIELTEHIVLPFEQFDKSIIGKYRNFHQKSEIELRNLAVVLRYHPNIEQIFNKRPLRNIWITGDLKLNQENIKQVGVLFGSPAQSRHQLFAALLPYWNSRAYEVFGSELLKNV